MPRPPRQPACPAEGRRYARPVAAPAPHTAVLVEGISDQRAVEALAARHGRDLAAEGVSVDPIGGAQAIGAAVAQLGPRGLGLRLAGLCDVGEERHFRRALERAGLGRDLTREDMERLGFFVCVDNLEHELVRAVGADDVERIVAENGELRALRTYQKQPAHRHRPREDQLHGFMWNRKIRYATLLVEALDLARVPRPLAGLLAFV
jgi:hypothetical protein